MLIMPFTEFIYFLIIINILSRINTSNPLKPENESGTLFRQPQPDRETRR